MKGIETVMSVLATAGLWFAAGGMALLLVMAMVSRTCRAVLRNLGDELVMDPLEYALAGTGEATTRWSRALKIRNDQAWRARGYEDAPFCSAEPPITTKMKE